MKRTRRHQAGQVYRHRRKWYLRYRDDVVQQDGTVERVQLCCSLGDAVGVFRITKAAARRLAADFLQRINSGLYTPEGTMPLNRFVEQFYLPYAKRSLTCPLTGIIAINGSVTSSLVGGLHCVISGPWMASRLLRDIAAAEDLSKTTLAHIKNFLSGVFRYAHRIGILNGANPIREVKVPKARPANQTYAYSLEEIIRMLPVLPEPAATIVATAAFTGPRIRRIAGVSDRGLHRGPDPGKAGGLAQSSQSAEDHRQQSSHSCDSSSGQVPGSTHCNLRQIRRLPFRQSTRAAVEPGCPGC